MDLVKQAAGVQISEQEEENAKKDDSTLSRSVLTINSRELIFGIKSLYQDRVQRSSFGSAPAGCMASPGSNLKPAP